MVDLEHVGHLARFLGDAVTSGTSSASTGRHWDVDRILEDPKTYVNESESQRADEARAFVIQQVMLQSYSKRALKVDHLLRIWLALALLGASVSLVLTVVTVFSSS